MNVPKSEVSQTGFDYGTKPFMMLVADTEFSSNFDKAECVGLAYGADKSQQPAELAFNFVNEAPAKLFFDSLMAWVEKSDMNGNAVDLEFIERLDGGYTLTIAPNADLFIKRMVPSHLSCDITPIQMIMSQFKTMGMRSKFYEHFRDNYLEGRLINVAYYITTADNKLVKKGEQSFKKSSFAFLQEGNIPVGSASFAFNAVQDKDFKLEDHKSRQQSSSMHEELTNRREAQLQRYFPVTLNKVKGGWLQKAFVNLERKFTRLQITQAICNLILHERLKRESHYNKFTGFGHTGKIIEYLSQNFESFDSFFPDDNFFKSALIRNQIEQDTSELNFFLKRY